MMPGGLCAAGVNNFDYNEMRTLIYIVSVIYHSSVKQFTVSSLYIDNNQLLTF